VIARPRDLNGDGVVDFPFGAAGESHAKLTSCGAVPVEKGHLFWVDAWPRNVVANTPVTLSIGQATPLNPYVLVIKRFNGTPSFTPIAIGALDVAGRAALAGTVPPSLSACTIDFQAITLDATGGLLFSGVETLTIQ
jgi:hypothetical protein